MMHNFLKHHIPSTAKSQNDKEVKTEIGIHIIILFYQAFINDMSKLKAKYVGDNILIQDIENDDNYDCRKLITDVDLKQLTLNDLLLAEYNRYLSSVSRIIQPKCYKSISQDGSHMTEILSSELLKHKRDKNKISKSLSSLTDAELKAINIYSQDPYYILINDFLIGNFSTLAVLNDDALLEIIFVSFVIVAAINKPLPANKMKTYELYRGDRSKYFQNIPENVDTFFAAQNKLLSCSKDEAVAMNLLRLEEKRKVLLHFPQVTGKNIKTISYYPQEKEVLFFGNTFFFTKSSHDAADVLYYKGIVITDSEDISSLVRVHVEEDNSHLLSKYRSLQPNLFKKSSIVVITGTDDKKNDALEHIRI